MGQIHHWAVQNENATARPSIFYGPMCLIGSHLRCCSFDFTPGPSGRASKSRGQRRVRGRKTRRRSRRAPPPELRDGRRKRLRLRLRLAVLRFSSPEPPRCHQVLRFDLALAPLVYSLACVALVVRRVLAAHGRGTSPGRAPLSACGGSFAQVMRSDEREISSLGLLLEEPSPDQGSGSVR
jgi:hypothetical protein